MTNGRATAASLTSAILSSARLAGSTAPSAIDLDDRDLSAAVAEHERERYERTLADADAIAEIDPDAVAADAAADAAIAEYQRAELHGAPRAVRADLRARADAAAVTRSATPDAWRAPRAPDLVDAVVARRHEPWVGIGMGGVDLVEVPLRAVVTITGGPGSGKTTATTVITIEHHLSRGGAVVYLSRELLADEIAARIVGIREGVGWSDVLRGRVAPEVIRRALTDLPRLAILDGDDASISRLEMTLGDLRREMPDAPILAVVDYVQIMGLAEVVDPRMRVEHVVESLRRIAQRMRIVVVLVSQTSRESARALRSGQSLGLDTMSTGAESAAIERASYATIAIGQHTDRGDGTAAVDISIGKVRLDAGDVVVPAIYDGRTGQWTITGTARATETVRAERAVERARDRSMVAQQAVLAAAEQSRAPLTRTELRDAAACQRDLADAAIRALLARGELVEVDRRRPRQSARMVWTPALARQHGIPIWDGATGGLTP